MPVYLCECGAGAPEPWRHGIPVYATPFEIKLDNSSSRSGSDAMIQSVSSPAEMDWNTASEPAQQLLGGVNRAPESSTAAVDGVVSVVPGATPTTNVVYGNGALPIRRIRHAEVVLVDDVCVAFGRYWVRLRWPGRKGGFAGYIAMGLVSKNPRPRRTGPVTMQEIAFPSPTGAGATTGAISGAASLATSGSRSDPFLALRSSAPEDRIASEEADLDDPTREDEPQETSSTKSSEPVDSTAPPVCLRTGIPFPTSAAMKLMSVYDDGLSPAVACTPVPTEPVFCRICREGLHEDADEQQPSGAAEDGENEDVPTSAPSEEPLSAGALSSVHSADTSTKGPVLPHPSYSPNPHAAENPLLAPCECSGSMAFVHYLCVEQWRCRSRHPEARNGLQCETCGGQYSLPPPSARNANVPQVEVEDWLDAMPPHVMAALRLPHLGWQIGAAVVRRRWLRPIAPVIMSPLVALYCRARRLLKKRGVARRRWACSLCRRRARWKCVRCLRSYYCSRQCQNVSWHIVHKHVCYKPSRFWWSVVVYGVGTILAFPGIVRDPLMYDLGFCTIPASFVIMAILGGGLATLLKKSMGMDLRGRTFELVVLLLTLWLVVISWGAVGGFFGDASKCYGAVGSLSVSSSNLSSHFMLNVVHKIILKPAQTYYLFWDRLASKSGSWLRKALCTTQTSSEGCFEHLSSANADFILRENDGQRCASDLLLVVWLYISAGFVLVGQNLWKRRERQRRARRHFREEPRLHQD